jgi:hypothetical protein
MRRRSESSRLHLIDESDDEDKAVRERAERLCDRVASRRKSVVAVLNRNVLRKP